uniref:Glucose-6-phosphate isomerase n=1 Tax=Spumella elongata TaxID=89044 RepID=A0A7S3GQM9_9STRA|mmetsp:Transcript_13863/g.24405  ORF Transcript_13863/g.24405 Transcript_13863/m.24405 type:complete len:557 (+) Transcript_13863:89-1759(+)
MSLINETPQWKRLEEHSQSVKQTHLRTLMQDTERCFALMAEHKGILLDYSRENVLPETMDMLFDLAGAAGLEDKRTKMGNGQHINATEDRAVMHIALRSPKNKQFLVDGEDVVPEIHAVLDKVAAFAEKVRSGQWVGATGKAINTVVAIGIGGSFLGPEFVYEALRTDPEAAPQAAGRTLRFLANVDPVDTQRALSGLNPETTLAIVVSKTFTTAETMLNARTVRQWLLEGLKGQARDVVIRQHMVAVSTAVGKATDFGISAENIFGFWDWVGGRFSVCSAVGVLPLALQYGYPVVQQFLAGAHDMDAHFFEAPLRGNIPVLLGLLGVWNSSFLGHPARVILPYAQGLVRFAAHIQQVDMESNGKRVSVEGQPLPYACGEIIFGEPGTNGQHSFYQLIHQGRVVPAEFIGYCKSPHPVFLEGEVVSNHDELMSNFFAQPDALAYGKTVSELMAEGVPAHLHPHKEFPGNRPSLSLLFPELNAFSCGQLLAMYEHRVAVQGFVWGLNSFDQWGVELGKVLANKVRSQLASSRGQAEAPITGFNASTTCMMQKYLKTA